MRECRCCITKDSQYIALTQSLTKSEIQPSSLGASKNLRFEIPYATRAQATPHFYIKR
jgi:hypothetical protein